MVELRQVSVGPGRVPALVGLDLSLGPGEMLVAAGPRGAGKRALVRLLLGQERARAGHVRVLGTDLVRASEGERRRLRARMSMVSRRGALISNLSVFDNLALPLRYHGGVSEPDIERKVVGALETVALAALRTVRPWELSRAQIRLAALARAVAGGAELILLQDPFEGMDDTTCDHISAALDAWAAGGALVVATTPHRTDLALQDQGRLLRPPRVQVLDLGAMTG